MRIIGINLSHDGSACLLENGEVRVALALERLVRVQRGVIPVWQVPRAMAGLIDYCLSSCNLSIGDIDYFAGTTTETTSNEDEAQILRDIGYFPPEKIVALPHPSHHLAHACAAFYGSGFDAAAALIIDAYGSIISGGRECETAFTMEHGKEPRVLFRNRREGARIAGILKQGRLTIPKQLFGVGEIYRVMALLLGFRQRGTYYDDPGKAMGLAPFGRRLSQEPQLIRVTDGKLDFDNAYKFLEAHNLVCEEDGVSYLSAKHEGAPFSQFHKDLAYQVQWEFEEACLHLVRKVLKEANTDTLVLGGGSFLNSVLNYRILRETNVRRLFIFPAATDDGNSLGAAWYAHYARQGRSSAQVRRTQPIHASLGRTYSDEQIRAALDSYSARYDVLEDERTAAEAAADKLAAGEIIGWFQGGAELGPRALGHRSILANPCLPGIQDRVNSSVKFRESFRPFAGSVPEEDVHQYFDLTIPASPYMLLVCPVKESARELIPGVTHVDGTCRVQTVSAQQSPLYHALIKAFGGRTGTPVVLNTSFNLRGMPIVETPRDALHCFFSTQMNALAIGRFMVHAPDFASFVPIPQWSEAPGDGRPSLGASELSSAQRQMLQLIDGKSTLGAMWHRLGLDANTATARYLALYRKGYFRWEHVKPLRIAADARAHFNLSS